MPLMLEAGPALYALGLTFVGLCFASWWCPRRQKRPVTGQKSLRITSADSASTATGPSIRSPRTISSQSFDVKDSTPLPVSCDIFACCNGIREESAAPSHAFATDRAPLERKFGHPRSELYSTTFYPINEDISALLEVAVRDSSKHQEVERNLQHLRRLCDELPACGWLQPQDPRVLLRFLLARKCNVERALNMIQSVLSWRQQSGAANLLPLWDKVQHEKFDSYWKTLGVTGVDRDGDPVLFERIGILDAPGLASCNQEFILRHTMYTAECMFASFELTRRKHLERGSSRGFQATVVLDMAGFNLSFADPRALAMCKAVARLEADNYPEAIKRIIIVRAPWIFPAIFSVCRPFLDQGTMDKMNIVSESRTTEAILEHVPAEYVPKALGGTLTSSRGDEFCSDIIAPGGKIPQDLIDMTHMLNSKS
mmetsp:Transcript_41546/g.96714  ORF Transcript_41546/g.96714 Transcript_41546/m.96714 type:complete len:426 (+) Transcript_41546:33-1310(+)